jgi:hypothetical protein
MNCAALGSEHEIAGSVQTVTAISELAGIRLPSSTTGQGGSDSSPGAGRMW